MKVKKLLLFAIAALLLGCNPDAPQSKKGTTVTDQTNESLKTSDSKEERKTTGNIDRLDPRLDKLIQATAKIEILADGFDWVEGPLWLETQQAIIFSDIPKNTIFKWDEKEGLKTYLHPSGYTGSEQHGREPGSNALLLDDNNNLVLCQHGDRRMAQMESVLTDPKPNFKTLTNQWQGKKLNSPNDATFDAKGNLLFTDPPYGLPQQMNDPKKEIDFQGVYRFSVDDQTTHLLIQDLSRPNGIALSPDEKTLYVANSDPEKAIWMAYDYDGAQVSNGRVFYDVTDKVATEKGLPDGLKVDKNGNLWATGPGGVWVFTAQGEHLGTIKTGQATSNCALNAQESTLFMTADMYLLRVVLSD